MNVQYYQVHVSVLSQDLLSAHDRSSILDTIAFDHEQLEKVIPEYSDDSVYSGYLKMVLPDPGSKIKSPYCYVTGP